VGKKGDLSIFERGIVVGARRAGLSISSAQLLGFLCTTISRIYKEWCEKGKTSSMRQSSVGENALLMLKVRGE